MPHRVRVWPPMLSCTQDEEYTKAGATVASRGDAFSQDITLKLRPPDIASEVPQFKDGTRRDAAPPP